MQSMEMRITGFIETDGRPRDMSEKAAAFTKVFDYSAVPVGVFVFGLQQHDGVHDRRDSELIERVGKTRRITQTSNGTV